MIGRELRRRIKKAFDAEGIEIPFPHMSLYFGEASKPFLAQQAETGSVPTLETLEQEGEQPRKTQRRIRTADSEAESDGGYE